MKIIADILANRLVRLKSMGLYDPMSSEEESQEFGHTVFEPLPPNKINEVQHR